MVRTREEKALLPRGFTVTKSSGEEITLNVTPIRMKSPESLREEVLSLIYDADWEIKGVMNARTKDITGHHMIDEERVFLSILGAIAARPDTIVAMIPQRRMEHALTKKTRILNRLRWEQETEEARRQ